MPTTDSFITAYLGAVGWADYDSDGDLDLLIVGEGANNLGSKLRLYRNNAAAPNTAPSVAANLNAVGNNRSPELRGDSIALCCRNPSR